MALGDEADIAARAASVAPPWYGEAGDTPPVLGIIHAMKGRATSWLYAMLLYARLQTRIGTMTGGWLDMAAQDFFGPRIRRRGGQSDTSFRARIKVELFRERGTRNGMTQVLLDLTGNVPRIFEPLRPADTSAWGMAGGWGASGGYGGLSANPGEVFLTVFREPRAGIPLIPGWGQGPGGWGASPHGSYVSLDEVTGQLTDADLYGAIEAVRPVGILCWVQMAYAAPAAA